MTDHFELQLASRLSAGEPAVDGHHHPDAASLTAFRERRIDSSSRARVALHLSQCSRCRDVLLLAAHQPTSPARSNSLRTLGLTAAAAVLLFLFAGTTSQTEDVVVLLRLANLSAQAEHWPTVTRAVSVVASSEGQFRWRLRNTNTSKTVESSMDAGKTWKPARINQPIDPVSIGFQGTNVWIKGHAGDMLLSRDLGRNWLHVKARQVRRTDQTR